MALCDASSEVLKPITSPSSSKSLVAAVHPKGHSESQSKIQKPQQGHPENAFHASLCVCLTHLESALPPLGACMVLHMASLPALPISNLGLNRIPICLTPAVVSWFCDYGFVSVDAYLYFDPRLF